MDGNKLINNAHSSTSNYNWSLKTKGGLVYIENKEKNKVLELEYRKHHWEKDKLIEEDFVEDNPKQLWKKEKPYGDNTEGYFFLGSYEDAEKVLSATRRSASALEIRSM